MWLLVSYCGIAEVAMLRDFIPNVEMSFEGSRSEVKGTQFEYYMSTVSKKKL